MLSCLQLLALLALLRASSPFNHDRNMTLDISTSQVIQCNAQPKPYHVPVKRASCLAAVLSLPQNVDRFSVTKTSARAEREIGSAVVERCYLRVSLVDGMDERTSWVYLNFAAAQLLEFCKVASQPDRMYDGTIRTGPNRRIQISISKVLKMVDEQSPPQNESLAEDIGFVQDI